jgi:hypothetical protein
MEENSKYKKSKRKIAIIIFLKNEVRLNLNG